MNNSTELQMHRLYCEMTGLDIPMRFGRDRAWSDFVRLGFTLDDLRLVISYLKKGIARQERNPGCLKFRNLIEQPDAFEEDLAMARKAANQRHRQPQADQPKTVQIAPGEAVTRLDKAPEPEIPQTREIIQKTMADFRRQMRGPRGS